MGATAIEQPAIVLSPADCSETTLSQIEQLDAFDGIVFVSRASVDNALRLRPRAIWPDRLKIYAVGPATANAARMAGFEQVISPEGQSNSEALVPLIAVSGVRKVLVFAARGGRRALSELLEQHAVQVSWCYVYRREHGKLMPGVLEEVEDNSHQLLIAAHSNAILDGLTRLLGVRRLAGKPICAASERIAGYAKTLGYSGALHVAAGADDEAMLAGLNQLAKLKP